MQTVILKLDILPTLKNYFYFFILLLFCFNPNPLSPNDRIPLYFWSPDIEEKENFGDYLSKILIERILGENIENVKENFSSKKFLAVGSILHFANENDLVWGSGINGKHLDRSHYKFSKLDVRSVRGPLTRKFLQEHFQIKCPKIYGDPVLLMPYFFPEFKRKKNPSYEYVIIPHISEEIIFPKVLYPNVIYPSDPWHEIVERILDSKLVISSSLHGIIVAEAFGVPCRMLRITENEPLFKYQDYYLGTKRGRFRFARSVSEALNMGGEKPISFNWKKMYNAFPFKELKESNSATEVIFKKR